MCRRTEEEVGPSYSLKGKYYTTVTVLDLGARSGYGADVISNYKQEAQKGPHIVHLSTMCHLFEESARAAIFAKIIY